MGKITKQIDYVIYLLLLFYTLIDCISGLFAMYGLPGVSVPYKIFLIFLMMINIKSYNGMFFYSSSFSLIFCCLFHYFFYDYSDFSTSMAMILRIIMAPFIFLYIKNTFKIKDKKLYKIAKSNLIIISINLFIGLLGFGNKTYSYSEEAFGVKGFIIDGNSLTVALFVLFVFFIMKFPKYKIRISLLFLVLGILVCTKTSILAIILFAFYFFINKTSKKNKLFIFILLSFLTTVLIIFILNSDFFAFQIWRIKNLMKLFDGNILSVILSGRDKKLLQHFAFFNQEFSIQNLLFGYGFLNSIDIIELDLFDTFFSYGFIFFIIVFSFYLYCFYINRKNKCIVFFNFLYFSICLTSGHIWFNTISALFFGIVNFYFLEKKSEQNLLHN